MAMWLSICMQVGNQLGREPLEKHPSLLQHVSVSLYSSAPSSYRTCTQVSNLVESPTVVGGSFADKFLELPK